MISRFTDEIFKENRMIFPELLPLKKKKLTLPSQVSNIPTALACSSIDNQAMPYWFWFGHSMHIIFKCFQKIKFNARNTRAGNQKRDLPFLLTATEAIM